MLIYNHLNIIQSLFNKGLKLFKKNYDKWDFKVLKIGAFPVFRRAKLLLDKQVMDIVSGSRNKQELLPNSQNTD